MSSHQRDTAGKGATIMVYTESSNDPMGSLHQRRRVFAGKIMNLPVIMILTARTTRKHTSQRDAEGLNYRDGASGLRVPALRNQGVVSDPTTVNQILKLIAKRLRYPVAFQRLPGPVTIHNVKAARY